MPRRPMTPNRKPASSGATSICTASEAFIMPLARARSFLGTSITTDER